MVKNINFKVACTILKICIPYGKHAKNLDLIDMYKLLGGCGGNENRFETLRECQRVQRLCLRGRRPPPLPIPFDPHK